MALANEWCDIFFLVVVALILVQSAGELVSVQQVGNKCCWKFVIVARSRKPSNINDTDNDTNETASTPPTPTYTTPGTTETPIMETPGSPMIETPATPDKLASNEGTNDAPLPNGGNYYYGSPPSNGGNYGGGYGGNYGGGYGGNYGGGYGGNYGGGYDYVDPNPGYYYNNYGNQPWSPGVPTVIFKDGKWVLRDDI